jgi:FlaA1/EpsC-like NDP-sugar epimerase
MSTFLVTGASGFLGTEICKELISRGHQTIGTVFSERNAQVFMKNLPEAKTYLIDLSTDFIKLENIFFENQIDYVIHCAAMKHVNICQNNPTRCIKTNVVAPLRLSEMCQTHGVKNLIGLSTDKANNPSCIYGYSKKLMESSLLEKGYAIYKGVNFFGSSGSVIDIWKAQVSNGEEITVNSQDTIRYFIKSDQVVSDILSNIDNSGVLLPLDVYKISLHDLAKAFTKFHNHEKIRYFKTEKYEKVEEEIEENINVKSIGVDDIINIFLRSKK